MRTTGNGNHTGECTRLPGANDAVQVEPLIVIAEEQPAIRELLRWVLHLEGYRMMGCVDRQAALTWGEQTMIPADLQVMLLLDLSPLCAQEAADFLGRVRARWQAFCRVLPQIIVLTTHPNVQAYLDSWECMLLKPFRVRDLLALIRRAMEVTSLAEGSLA